MNVYHEISPDSLSSMWREGLKTTDRGAKGQDEAIIDADVYLDSVRPPELVNARISRCHNLYGYLGKDDFIVDIKTGISLSVKEKLQHNTALLKLKVDATRCWVSDLDLYDVVKEAVSAGDTPAIERLATQYWQSLISLELYEWGRVKRPEVMITYDLHPKDIIPL